MNQSWQVRQAVRPCARAACWLAVALVTAYSRVATAAVTPVDDSYSARVWQADDGLPENRVVGVVQSADGFLWVATQGGLVRFDGVRFQRVDLAGAPGTIAGTMRALIQDRQGRIWLAKEEGGRLFCFEGAEVRVLNTEQGLPGSETQRSLAVDGEGRLWVSYTSGKLICCQPDGRVQTFTSNEGLPAGGGVCWLASGRDGKLWFAKGSRVGVFREGRFHVLENFGSAALQITPARSSGIWICVDQRVLRFDPGMETLELGRIVPAEARDRAGLEPTVLLEDRSGAVWVGTLAGGLFRCDSNSIVRVEVSNPGILSLAEDREGNVWVGTRGGGLNQVHRRMTRLINSSAGLPFGAVQSVSQDASGGLWAVGDNGVLARGEGTKPGEGGGRGRAWAVQRLSAGDQPAYVTCVAAAASRVAATPLYAGTNGDVWVGARGGWLYRWAEGEFREAGLREGLQGKAVRSLLETRTGELWIGTDSSEEIYRLSAPETNGGGGAAKAIGRLQAFRLPPGRRFVRALAEDAAGNVWAGASDGLLVRVTGDELEDETARSLGVSIRSLYGAGNGDLWIGYAGAGVGRAVRRGASNEWVFTRFTTEQGLPNDYVSQILEDDREGLWFAGNQGLFQVRKADFEGVANGEATRVWPVVYGRSEGLAGLQASFDYCPSSVRAANGRLYFSMLSGLAEVRTDEARLNYRPPEVWLERVTADEKVLAVYQLLTTAGARHGMSPVNSRAAARPLYAVELRGHGAGVEVRVPPGSQQVRFEFTALSFVAPENVQFRYQLVGLDANWVEAGYSRVAATPLYAGSRRFASYTHVPPGRYRFEVTACNNDGIWNKVGDSLGVVFEPFVWETWWFRLGAVVAGVVVLCGGVVVVVRRRHRLQLERLEHQRALELERTRIARDLHDDLGVGLTEIGLLGDLVGGSAALPVTNREQVQEMTGRARALAASLDEIVWAINPANDRPESLVDYFFPYAQRLLGRAGIRCRLQVVEPLPGGDLNAERRHEVFHAYKEALNNVIRHSGASEVQISFCARAGDLLIRVADNGRGLAPGGERGSHHGLAGMRGRLERLGGRCEIAADAGGGTTVTFVVPVHSESKA